MCGRLVGTIGPQSATEPRHLVLGRHFMSTAGANGNFFRPAGLLNFCAGRVDDDLECLLSTSATRCRRRSREGRSPNIGDLSVG